MVQFYRFKQGLEIALAKAFIAFALDDFVENRPQLVDGENLQQQIVVWPSIEQNLIVAQTRHIFTVARQTLVEQFIIGIGRAQKLHTIASQGFHRIVNHRRAQGDVLYAFAVVHVEILLDLAFFRRAFFIDGNADFAARRRHRFGFHPCDLALNVKITHLAEIEQALVKFSPLHHAAFVDIVGQVVDIAQARTLVVYVVCRGFRIDGHKIHIINVDVAYAALLFAAPAVYQINQRIAYAFDGGYVQFHRATARRHAPCTQFNRALIRLLGIVHAKSDGTHRWAMQTRKALGKRIGLGIDDEIDVALAVEGDVFVAVAGNGFEAHLLEDFAHGHWVWGGVFDEFKAICAHWIVPSFKSHFDFLCLCFVLIVVGDSLFKTNLP